MERFVRFRLDSRADADDVLQEVFLAACQNFPGLRDRTAIRDEGGVRNYTTFLDGDEFWPAWGFGKDNCGNETHLKPKGDIRRTGSAITCWTSQADTLSLSMKKAMTLSASWS